jgi:hypothetical protein
MSRSLGTAPESGFQAQVLEIATLYGWLSFHDYDSRRSTPGFPDLVLVRAPELIFAELKTERGRVSDDQARWVGALSELTRELETVLAAATAAGANSSLAVDTYVWRPSDFDDILARLSRGRARRRQAA